MHTALQLTDILERVLGHCPPTSLATAAAVCRAWEKSANSILWRNVPTLWTLLRVLGPLEEGDRGMVRFDAVICLRLVIPSIPLDIFPAFLWYELGKVYAPCPASSRTELRF